MKRSELKRRTPLARGTAQLRRTPMKRKPPKNDTPVKVKTSVRERDGGCMAQIAEVCGGRPLVVHHVLRRSQGGDHSMGNLITLCSPCHDYIHGNPAWARQHGYIRSRIAS